VSAVGTFTITELGRVGGKSGGRPDGGEGEIFEWTSDKQPGDAKKGGARAIPKQPWAQGGKLRTVRTDYPGARTPSEQVLGPQHSQQSFTGRWDDRYNFPTYARGEMRRFEEMARRGNLIRLGFQELTYEGLITQWVFNYKRDWYIEYQFTVSVHDRSDDFTLTDRSPPTTKSPAEAFDDVNDIVNAMGVRGEEALREEALEAKLQTDATDLSKASLESMELNRDALGDTLDNQELAVSDTGNAVSPFRRLATQFRTVGNDGFAMLQTLTEVRSDVDLAVRTALSVLAFEDWSRSLRFQSRVLMGTSSEAANNMDERAEPDALRLYRPHKGESLYAISRRFYGTPHSWRLIADRNALTDFELTGDEVLIIPERGTG